MSSFETEFVRNNLSTLRSCLKDAKGVEAYFRHENYAREIKKLVQELESACRLEVTLKAYDIYAFRRQVGGWLSGISEMTEEAKVTWLEYQFNADN